MPFDLGAVVPLTFTTMTNGALVSAASVTLTITQPDMTTAGPFTVAPTSPGVYNYNFTPTQAGRYIARWVATGPASAYTDAFDIDPADPGFLISLADAKAALRITGTANDAELRLHLEAVTDVVENFCGDILPRTYTEQHNGGASTIVTYHQPILSVSSLTAVFGNTTWTLTNQPPGSATDYYGYSIDDASAGVITRRGPASIAMPFETGPGGVSITYTAGWPVIPAGIRLAAQIILQHLWRTQRASLPVANRNGDPEATVPVDLADLPSYAITLMERYEKLPGIG